MSTVTPKEPAATIIAELGGFSCVARIVGVHRTRVWNWTRPRERGGTGGSIPASHHRVILAAAKDAGMPITAEDLLPPDEPRRPRRSRRKHVQSGAVA